MTRATPRPPTRIPTPRLWVWLDEDSPPELVQSTNVDMVEAERVARQHKWGSMSESPLLYLTFIAWSAMRRSGKLPDGMTFETFRSSTAAVQDADDDDDDPDGDGSPTPPDPGSG